MSLVIILWTDSTESHGWVDQHDLPEIADCKTVGFLVAEDERQVVIASSKDSTNGGLNGVMAIPKVAIRERIPVSDGGEDRP